MVILLFVGMLRALQFYAVEMIERRVFARIALALARQLPRFSLARFRSKDVNYFFETVLLQRALAALLADIINVLVAAVVGMTLLVLYHPYFLAFNFMLAAGGALVVFTLGHGGLASTLQMSHAKYDTVHWMQDIASNLAHFKGVGDAPVLLAKTDHLVAAYLDARRQRFGVLIRQYVGSIIWQALGHSGMILTGGWLLAEGQLTLGQFVAAEVIVGSLLLSFDSVVKRMYVVFYFVTALTKLDHLFSQSKDRLPAEPALPAPASAFQEVRLTCTALAVGPSSPGVVLEPFDLTVEPGKKVAILATCHLDLARLARMLAGPEPPESGTVRYNGIVAQEWDSDSLGACRGVVLTSQATLFDGTLRENIALGRSTITYSDLRRALWLTELEDEVDALPLGLETRVEAYGETFSPGQILRILVARAVVTHPPLLILEGTLHSMPPNTRDIILRRLCAEEESWSVVLITHDPLVAAHAHRQLALKPDSSAPIFRDRDSPRPD
jgi:ABC-type bacteriocin/lantibiotic exporter with double-glycine peptidase domain